MSIHKIIILTLFTFLSINLHSEVFIKKPEGFIPKMDIVACYFEHEGQILILHRQNHVNDGNSWGIPGGKAKKTETLKQAIIREVAEEIGFDISKQDVEYLGKVYITTPQKDFVYHMFRSSFDEKPGDVTISYYEHKGFTWVTVQDAYTMKLMQDEGDCFKLIYEGDYTILDR